jgi:hypothetical protein
MEGKVGVKPVLIRQFKGGSPVFRCLGALQQQLPPGVDIIFRDFPVQVLCFDGQCGRIPGDDFKKRVAL